MAAMPPINFCTSLTVFGDGILMTGRIWSELTYIPCWVTTYPKNFPEVQQHIFSKIKLHNIHFEDLKGLLEMTNMMFYPKIFDKHIVDVNFYFLSEQI